MLSLARNIFVLLLIGTPWLLGCAPTAQLQVWHPARLEVSGLGRMAVARFDGAAPWNVRTQTSVEQKLVAADVYQLIHCPALDQPVAPAGEEAAGSLRILTVMEAAKLAGADALLVAGVEVQSTQRRLGTTVAIGDPMTRVTVNYQLIDVRTGTLIVGNKITRHHQGEVATRETAYNSAEKITQRLVDKCSEDIVERIAARQVNLPVTLGTNTWGEAATHIREGNDLAKKGDWAAAASCWELAVVVDPENHAAHYNLGLACEAKHDYANARKHYERAKQLSDRSDYDEALARLDKAEPNYRTAMLQSDRPLRMPAP